MALTPYSYRTTQTYDDSVRKYATNTQVKAALFDTLQALVEDPFDHPRLSTHRVKRAQGETFVSDVGGRKGKRLIWRRVGQRTIVLLLVGEHDVAYRRAEHLRLEIDDMEERLRVYDSDPSSGERRPYQERRQVEGTLFMAYSDAELIQFGIGDSGVRVLRGLNTEEELLGLEQVLGTEAWNAAINLYLYGNAEGEQAAAVAATRREEAELGLPEPTTDVEAERLIARQLRRVSSRAEFAPIEPEELAEVLTKPIEDWMVFLHPDQARLSERAFSGPARIRGAAGTGKTVVGLHRAQYLARTSDGPILFTTFIRTLPPVLENLFRRLAPSQASKVEFRGLHSWAARFLNRRRIPFTIDTSRIDAAFDGAWRVACASEPLLNSTGLPKSYFREEIDWVIKGRELNSLDEYLSIARTGRGTPFSNSVRRAVWRLAEEYAAGLAWQRVIDFNDLLLLALENVRDEPIHPSYKSVIVDESQDLTEVGIRLIYELGGRDQPNGVLLLGDGQQSVYPGGYSLNSLGIQVKGRSAILLTNYRNTQEILSTAMNVVGDRPYDDNDDELVTGDRGVKVLRSGPPPAVAEFRDVSEHDSALFKELREAIQRPGVDLGDVAVLVPDNHLARRYLQQLEAHGIPALSLENYDGTHSQAVRVGTYRRSKGLEFKIVLMPCLGEGSLGERQRDGEDDSTFSERIDLIRRQLFVAMTRARDILWMGTVGTPTELLGLEPDVSE
jgi:AAA domain/UvrD-like helicase C-terminal domain